MYNIKINYQDKNKLITFSDLYLEFVLDDDLKSNQISSIEMKLGIKFSENIKNKILLGLDDVIINNQSNLPEAIIIKLVKIDNNFSSDYFRNYIAKLIKRIYNLHICSLTINIPEFKPFEPYFQDNAYFTTSFIEGLYFGNYKFNKYKSDKKERKNLSVNLLSSIDNLQILIKYTEILMKGVDFARDLENEPSNYITPESFCEIVKEEFKNRDINIEEWGESEIISNRMFGLLAVGKGSNNKPRFLKIQYKPETSAIKKIVLIGKGVTFDSGGISIKPSADMWEMKADMSGAAVVAAVISVCESLNLPIEVLCFIPLAENMPSGTAQKPGDIITTMSGKTIEVDNTDAEGRLLLSDALSLANKENADLIIDVATLTGAVVVALGFFSAGLFTHNDNVAEMIARSGINTFEKVWRLPLWNEYNDLIKSDVADMKNTGGRWGGAITAAKFLENFIEEKSGWVHIDIAGPSFPSERSVYTEKYMTGFGVRLLVDFLSKYCK